MPQDRLNRLIVYPELVKGCGKSSTPGVPAVPRHVERKVGFRVALAWKSNLTPDLSVDAYKLTNAAIEWTAGAP